MGLLEEVSTRLADPASEITHLVLDFEHMTGIDTSALNGLTKIKRLVSAHDVSMAACSMDPRLELQLKSEEFAEGNAAIERIFADGDEATEWAEDEILRQNGIEPHIREHDLDDVLRQMVGSESDPRQLRERFERVDLDHGEYLVRSHETERALFFVESGLLTISAEREELVVRIRRVSTGALLGIADFHPSRVTGATGPGRALRREGGLRCVPSSSAQSPARRGPSPACGIRRPPWW